jgi:PTS system mannose-specific IIC component
MTISWLQAVLLALMASMTSVIGALGTTYSWYTLSRPLVASFVVGLIIGDLQTSIMVGAAIQVVYIALVTPGGTVSADLRAVSYIGVPLAVAAVNGAGLDPASVQGAGLAVSIGALVGTVGTVMFYSTATMNLIWQQIGWKSIDSLNYKVIYLTNFIFPLISHFVIAFLPTLFITYYGTDVVANLKDWLPMDGVLMKTMFTLGTLLPAVGIGILLKQVVSKGIDLIVFFFGFTLAAALGINLIGAAFVGGMIAFLNYKIVMVSGNEPVTTEEEDL